MVFWYIYIYMRLNWALSFEGVWSLATIGYGSAAHLGFGERGTEGWKGREWVERERDKFDKEIKND